MLWPCPPQRPRPHGDMVQVKAVEATDAKEGRYGVDSHCGGLGIQGGYVQE